MWTVPPLTSGLVVLAAFFRAAAVLTLLTLLANAFLLPVILVYAALLTSLFPKVVSAFPPGYVFLFFAFMMTVQLVWVRTMVIETKGVPLEQIQVRLKIAEHHA